MAFIMITVINVLANASFKMMSRLGKNEVISMIFA